MGQNFEFLFSEKVSRETAPSDRGKRNIHLSVTSPSRSYCIIYNMLMQIIASPNENTRAGKFHAKEYVRSATSFFVASNLFNK